MREYSTFETAGKAWEDGALLEVIDLPRGGRKESLNATALEGLVARSRGNHVTTGHSMTMAGVPVDEYDVRGIVTSLVSDGTPQPLFWRTGSRPASTLASCEADARIPRGALALGDIDGRTRCSSRSRRY